MKKTTDFKSLLRRLYDENYQYLAAFFLPVLIMWLAYSFFGVYPFSNRSVLALDLNGQYANYFDYLHDVLAGKESLFYSWSRNLSGEFMGVIGYYLASPFTLIVLAFPRLHLTEGLLAMILAKIGTTGVCAAIYLHRNRRLSIPTTVFFSMFYALCGYTITQTMNPMWLDGVLILPLVVYGIEALISKGRFRMLTGALIYAFVSNFYIGFMIAIFTVIYFFYYFFASDEFTVISLPKTIGRLGIFGLSAITAAACSAFMLIPVYNSLKLGKFEFSQPDYTVKSNFNLIEFADRLLPNSYDTVRMSGTPLIYCGILTVIMAVCYFIGGKRELISRRTRFCGVALLLVMTVSMYIRPVDMFWHGGQMPNWLPYRYSFILSFLLVIWGAEAFDRISNLPKKTIGAVSGGFFALMVLLENKDNFDPELGSNGRELLDGITVILPSMLILFIITMILVQWRDKLKVKNAATVTLGVVIIGELFFNSFLTINKQNTDIVYSSRDSYVLYFEPMREVITSIKEKDDSFYRIEKDFFRTSNDEIALSMYGFSHSSSTMNTKVIEFLDNFGTTTHSHNTRYSGSTPLIDDIFGIKYILSSKNNDASNVRAPEDVTIEENLDAMPIAYLVDSGVQNFDFSLILNGEDTENAFSPQSKFLAYMIGKHEIPDYFPRIDTNDMIVETENLESSINGVHFSYKVASKGQNAEISYTMTADYTGEHFLWLPTSYQRRVNVYVERTGSDGIKTMNYAGGFFEADYHCIHSLGYFEAGEEFTVTLKLTKDEVLYKDVYITCFNEEVYNPDYNVLREMNTETEVEKISPTNLKITTNSDQSRLLLTTIPVEDGWTIKVNGVKTEYVEVAGALIGIPLEPGNNIVEMSFIPNGLMLGLIVTGGGIIVFVIMCLIYRHFAKASAQKAALQNNYGSYDAANDDGVDIDDFDEEIITPDSGKVYIGNYDEEKVMRDIESIVQDINDINDINDEDEDDAIPDVSADLGAVRKNDSQDRSAQDTTKGADRNNVKEYDENINSALDLFPEDEIERLLGDIKRDNE